MVNTAPGIVRSPSGLRERWDFEGAILDAPIVNELLAGFVTSVNPAWTFGILESLGDERYALRHPISYSVWLDGDSVVGVAHGFLVYGRGNSRDEAERDLKRSLLEEFDFLAREGPRLSPHLASELAKLRDVLSPQPSRRR